MRYIFFLIFLLGALKLSAQDSIAKSPYLEDQLYAGFSYILFSKQTNEVNPKGFSNSLCFGFIKDLPVNKMRNMAFGVGLGYARNTYYQNIFISKVNGQFDFSIIDPGFSYKTNKFSTHAIEIPFEFRWRTSTSYKYKFYRLYTGIKMSYIIGSNAKLKTIESKTRVSGIDEINKFQYGLTLSAGYGTWNINLYYGLSDIFKNASLGDTRPLTMKDIRLGLIFYIL